MEVRKSKKKKGQAIVIRLPKDIYESLENKCSMMDTEKENVIESLVIEWVESF